MPTRLCAINLGKSAAKLVVIESTLRAAEVIAADRLDKLPDEDQPTFLERVKRSLPERVDSFIVTADGASTSARLLDFPFSDTKKVEAAIGFELEGQLPYAMEDIALAPLTTEKSNTSSRVLVAVMQKERLAERINILTTAGMEPRAIVSPAVGLTELVPPSSEPVAVLSLGASESHLCVVKDGLRFVRTLRVGGDQVDRVLAKRLEMDLAKAKQTKEQSARLGADAEDAKMAEAVGEGLRALVSELAVSLKALRENEAPRRLYLTGGTSRIPGLAQHLEEKLKLPVELIDLTKALGTVTSPKINVSPEMAVATGLALALMKRGRATPLNFRRGAYAYAGDIQLYRGELIRAGVGLSAVILLALIGSIVRFTMINAEEHRLDESFCSVTEKIVGRCIKDPTVALSTMKQSPDVGGVVIPTYSAADIYEMMSKAVGSDADVVFSTLEIRLGAGIDDPDRINGKGEAADFETTEKLVGQLKRDKCVQDAEVSKQRKGRTDRVEFNFSAKIVCPPGYLPGNELGPVAAVSPPTPTGGVPPINEAPVPPPPDMAVPMPSPDDVRAPPLSPDTPAKTRPGLRRPYAPPQMQGGEAPEPVQGGQVPRVTFPSRPRSPFRSPLRPGAGRLPKDAAERPPTNGGEP